MKSILFKANLGLGQYAWVELTSCGVIIAKGDFHPEDPIFTIMIGSAKACYKAVMSTVRARRNNRFGFVKFSRIP